MRPVWVGVIKMRFKLSYMTGLNLGVRVGFPVAVLYFFFNSTLLPPGLEYTTLLTPFFLWWLYKTGTMKPLFYFLLGTLAFIPFHLMKGVVPVYYFRSYLLLLSACIFALAFRAYLISRRGDIKRIFALLLGINFLLVVLAVATFPLRSLRPVFWYLQEFSPGTGIVPRLKLLSYEASYYSLLLVPVVVYFYLRLILGRIRKPVLIFILTTVPLLLSLSLGVLAALGFTFFTLMAYAPRAFLARKQVVRFVIWSGVGVLAGAVLLLLMDPHNPLYGRIGNIFTGKDTSFRGRTYQAFILAWSIAKQKSVLFGCGPGQPKLLGISVFRQYYNYLPEVVRIPNTLADTLAAYGLVGLAGRLALTVFLFFRTKVSRNYYQFSMFLFMCLYQFTGSFMTNIAEYVIWVLAFTPAFGDFDHSRVGRGIQTSNLWIRTTGQLFERPV